MNDETTMLDVEIAGIGRVVENRNANDAAVWASAGEVLRERRYGDVLVTAEWPAAIGDTVRLPLRIGTNEIDAREVAELFVHDAFLLFNLAAPGSFGGTIAIQGAGEFTLDARVFEYAWAKSDSRVGALPLHDVASWYDELNLGSDVATTPVAKALFHLLHLARSPEDELLSVMRLAQAAAALGIRQEETFELLRGDIPVAHPAAENDELSLQWIDAADLAASAVVGAIQEQVRIRALR